MQLRNYQLNIVQEIYNCWSRGAVNVMTQLPTGAGKTVIISKIIEEHQGHCVAIAHRNELVSQLSLTLARFGIRHNIIGTRDTIREIIAIHNLELKRSYYDPNAICFVASVHSLVRLPLQTPWFPRISLVVFDEAHHVLKHNLWGRAAALFPNARGLLPTATPTRADGNGLGRHAKGLTDELVIGPTMRQLITEGYLTDYRIFAPKSDIDLTNVNVTSTGDYSPAKLRTAVHKSHITGDVVAHYMKIAPGKLGVTFAVDLKSAAEIACEFRLAGISAEVISSKTPPLLRQQLMRKFKNREILQLVNVDILGEGVDVPAIEVISMARPTQSYCTYAQQFGRALRPSLNKTHAIVIDHVNNVMRHGLPDATRSWSLDSRERRTSAKPEDVIPLKTCISCLSVYTRFLRNCPYCGHYQPPTNRSAPIFVDGDLHELDEEVLAKLRGEAERVYLPIHPPKHLEPYIQKAILNRHTNRMQEQSNLRNNIATWAGYLHAEGRSDSEIYRQFYHTFGTDILTAQSLDTNSTVMLNSKIVDNTGNME
jgi:DNA repair protein RadD